MWYFRLPPGVWRLAFLERFVVHSRLAGTCLKMRGFGFLFCFFKFLNSLRHFTSAEDEVVKIFTSIIGTNRGSEQLSTHTVTCWSENTPLSFVLFLKKKTFHQGIIESVSKWTTVFSLPYEPRSAYKLSEQCKRNSHRPFHATQS